MRRSAASAGVALLLLGACTGDTDPIPEPSVTPIPPPEAEEPESEDLAPPLEELPPDPDGGAPEAAPELGVACDDEERAGIDSAVAGQLDAFAVGDYAGALDFATEGFRAGRSPSDFEAIITEGFPIAADAASHATDGCRSDGSQATIQVSVVSAGGEIGGFAYLLEREPDGVWRIAGAVPADTQGGVA